MFVVLMNYVKTKIITRIGAPPTKEAPKSDTNEKNETPGDQFFTSQ
jgi:hypothetical protein